MKLEIENAGVWHLNASIWAFSVYEINPRTRFANFYLFVVEKSDAKEDKVGQEEEEGEKNPAGYVDIPEDEPIDFDAEEDIFNTDFVDAVNRGDVKLAVIPDSPGMLV